MTVKMLATYRWSFLVVLDSLSWNVQPHVFQAHARQRSGGGMILFVPAQCRQHAPLRPSPFMELWPIFHTPRLGRDNRGMNSLEERGVHPWVHFHWTPPAGLWAFRFFWSLG